jgi:superfamily II DNA or RNA helicase
MNVNSIDDYKRFLAIKSLPRYSFVGGFAEFPDEYAATIGLESVAPPSADYKPSNFLFDYQRDIAGMAIRKKCFSVFADCGLGKTLIMLEFAKHVAKVYPNRRVLIVSPLMVVAQTMAEADRWYGKKLPIHRLASADLAEWLRTGSGVGITNYNAIRDDLPSSDLAALILDESSMLKSHYGAWGTRLIELGKGVEYKLCLTGTPAPNDRIEFANHSVLIGAFPTINAFLAKFFVNRGQTSERWELKAWALEPFYRSLSDWCIFLSNPAVYGWKDGCGKLPPIHVHIHEVSLTGDQRDAVYDVSGTLFVYNVGGIGTRSRLARIGKGIHNGEKIDSKKTQYIVDLVASWPTESTIIWCKYNAEQDAIAAAFPGCGNVSGDTPDDKRQRIVDEFKAGKIRVLVTKPKILGFGLNLQICTRQVFSTFQDSYEEFYQAVKRSNRYGSTLPLNVHIPITEIEAPMLDTVLRKIGRVQSDTEQQERIFNAHAHIR